MKSLQRSWGKFFRILLIGLLSGPVASLVGCGMVRHHGDSVQAEPAQSEEVSLETTLENDQKTIDELRKNIPKEKRQDNDQLKEILALMGEVKDHPSKIRDRFNKTTQRMRQSERTAAQRLRENYNREEKKRRDDFYKKSKDERDDFNSSKNDKDARKRFYDDQDRARREFTADDRDKRAQFNADSKLKSDDFNTMMREKNNEFTQELRAYTQRYNDYQKELRDKKKNSNQAPSGVVTPMKTGDSDH